MRGLLWIEAVTVSVVNLFQANDDARRFGLVRRQLCKVRIAPFGKPYYLCIVAENRAAGISKSSAAERTLIKLNLAD